MTRSELHKEYYFSSELKKASEYLLRDWAEGKSISQDLLSDCILEVFKKPDAELFDLHERKKLKSYIFLSMRNVVYGGVKSRAFRNYGLEPRLEVHANDITEKQSHDEPDSMEVTKEELEFSESIFGSSTKLNVQFMRAIELADNNKHNDIEAWESAQITKLYYEFRSFRKVSAATGIGFQQVRTHVKKFMSSLNKSKMNIVVLTHKSEPSSGMELYRLHYPYFEGLAQNHTGDVTIKRMTYQYLKEAPVGSLEDDVYVCSRLQDVPMANKIIESGKKLVIDIDDYWDVHHKHHLKNTPAFNDYVANITKTLPMAHLVTCTTPTLCDKLHDEFGITATIIKNTIPEVSQFSTQTFPHSKVRFGWVGGVYHYEDMKQMKEGIANIYNDKSLFGKFQFCLGGFNPNQDFTRYEQVMSNEYKPFKNADPDYHNYLLQMTPALDHIAFNKPYRRLWAKPVDSYGEMLREIDVALIPMEGKMSNGNQNITNACKSELKLIEAGMTGKAAIVSDVMPYHPYLKHEQNCLCVSEKSLNWGTQIRRMILDKDLRLDLADKLQKDIRKQFNHATESKKLLEALKKLK